MSDNRFTRIYAILEDNEAHAINARKAGAQAIESAESAIEAADRLQWQGQGLRELLQDLQQEIQGPIKGKGLQRGNNYGTYIVNLFLY